MDEELEDWVEAEIVKELEKISLEDLERSDEEEEGKENNESFTNLRSEDYSPVLSIQSLQRYLTLRNTNAKEVESELNTLIKEHDVCKNVNIFCPSLQSPPPSPPLSNANLVHNDDIEFEDVVDEEETNINIKMKETEEEIRTLMEERQRLELEHNEAIMKKEREERAVIVIQAQWRGYRARHQLALYKECINDFKRSFSALIIQSSWRRFVQKRRKEMAEKEKQEMEDNSAKKIQKSWRRHRGRLLAKLVLAAGRREKRRKELEEKKRKEMEERRRKDEREKQEHSAAAKKIQIFWRRQRLRSIAIAILTLGKAEKERKEREAKILAVTRIQHCWRHYKCRLLLKSIMETGRRERERKMEKNTNENSINTSLKKSHDSNIKSHDCNGQSRDQSSRSHDQRTQDELVQIAALREIRSQEELHAQHSRERMNKIMTHEQEMGSVAMATRNDPDYKARLEHAATPLSPHAWVGVVSERCKQWQERRGRMRVCKAPPTPFPPVLPPQPQATRSLTDAQLLATSPEGTKLDDVTVIHLYRARGGSLIDLTSFSRCPKLRILSLLKSSLVVLKDLGGGGGKEEGSDRSPNIEELSLSSNKLEYINCSNLVMLRLLDLSDNHLSSIHGLQNCKNLLELNLDENRIARIGGLDGCGLIQKLSINGNLIINSAGVASLPRLQYLSLSENHLPMVLGLEACPLLQFINLQQNNLQECITLSNHVLLRELDLSGNSLSDMGAVEETWLPSLQTLRVANNCISAISSLTCCIMLSTLDIRNNSLFDFPSFLQSVRGCYYLTRLMLDGNPITHEPKFKSHLVKALPNLQVLNEAELKQRKSCSLHKEITSHPLIVLTLRHISEQDEMRMRHNTELESLSSDSTASPSSLTQILDLKVSHSFESRGLLERHYQEHLKFNGGSSHTSTTPSVTGKLKHAEANAALTIQRYWRGYKERERYSKTIRAITHLQSLWRGVMAREDLNRMREETIKTRTEAALRIQALYHGYRLRKRLKELLSSSSFFNNDEDIEFDEGLLLQESEDSEESLKPLSPTDEDVDKLLLSPPAPSPRKQERHHRRRVIVPKFALPGAVQEETDEVEKGVELVGSSHGTRDRNTPEQVKQQRIIDEWGFSSHVTADLMMKRAGRHRKLKQASQQRLRLQDPSQRLNDFKKRNHQIPLPYMEKTAPYHNVMLNEKKQEPLPATTSSTAYQWSHQRRVVHRELLLSPPPPPIKMASTAATSLPQMELHVLVGHTPRLVTSKAQNELVRQSKQAWDK